MKDLIKEYLEKSENYKNVEILSTDDFNKIELLIVFEHGDGFRKEERIKISLWNILIFVNDKLNEK